MSRPTITLFTRPDCDASWYARRWLVWQDLPFEERALPDSDPRESPVVSIGDRVIQGYHPGVYLAAIYAATPPASSARRRPSHASSGGPGGRAATATLGTHGTTSSVPWSAQAQAR
jgi:hypothetical protein